MLTPRTQPMSSLRQALALPAAVILGAALTVTSISATTPALASPPRIDASGTTFVTPDFGAAGGTLPQNVTSGDFNGDGKLDAAVVNQGPSPLFGVAVGVNLGDGTGKIADAITTDIGSGDGACDLAAGDWNADASTDLVVLGCTTSGASSLVVLKAAGDGTFVVTQKIANSVHGQLVAGDFNKDGNGDFVFSARGTASVRTYVGKGDGTFKAPIVVNPSFDSYDLEAADLDGDHDLDLVGASGGPVWAMLNNGSGSFGSQVFAASDVVTGIELAVADFNGDKFPDVAVVDASGGHVGIGIGIGNGRFEDGDQITLGTRQAIWVEAGMVDKGKTVDIVAGLDNSSTASALLAGNGNGQFAKATHWVVGADGLAIADIDADGHDDLLSYADDRVYASLGSKIGFRAPRLTAGANSEDIVDLDGDGVVDKVTGAAGFVKPGVIRSDVLVQLGRGNGRFGKTIVSKIRRESASSGIGDIAVGDIDEDGTPDVVGGFSNFQPSPNNLFWVLGEGDGRFGAPVLSTTGDTNADVVALALADVTGDDHLDIIANTLSQLAVRPGNGDGTFDAPITSGSGGPGERRVLVADFTGDGELDVVTIVRTGDEDFGIGDFRLQQGHGDGTFTLIQTRTVDSNLASGAVADLNDDGRLDVVAAGQRGSNGGRNAMWVAMNVGGQLGAPVPYAGPTGQVAIADLDVDGDLDVATTGNETIDLYLNKGNGTFPRIDDVIAAGGLGTAADLNDDGAPDLVSGSPFGEFAVHLNAR